MNFELLWQSLLAGLTNSFVYALIGIGIAVIYKGTRIVNAMQGEFAVIGGMVTVYALSFHMPYLLAGLLGVVAGAISGLAIDMLFVRPMVRRKAGEEAMLLLTIGLAFTISAAVLYFAGRQAHLLPGIGGDDSLEIFGGFITVHSVWLIAISTAAVISLWVFYRTTIIGLSLVAASIDPDGAATNGINVSHMRTTTIVIGGTIGALAGILVTPLIAVSYQMGLGLTLKGFAAAVLGGFSNPLGAVVGALLIGISESLAVVGLSSGYKDAIALFVMVAVMIGMPNGLLGRAGRAEG